MTSGLIALNEEVTWKATHFGIEQTLTSKITAFEFPVFFRDEMVRGVFKKIKHDHRFEKKDGLTVMTDLFEFESPGGLFGKIFNDLILTDYLTRLIAGRNAMIKEYAESGKWKDILQDSINTP